MIKSLLSAAALSAVVTLALVPQVEASPKKAVLPVMRWDHAAQAQDWTRTALAVVAAHDGQLARVVPQDIEAYCPGYASASLEDRRAFWVAVLSATAKYESSFNAKAVGGKGRYVGLMQIMPSTAKHSGCEADSSAELKDGAANLTCAIRIAAPKVARDGLVAGRGNAGIARDWGPWASSKKRAAMAAWTSQQSYCRPKA
jgi:soluble lytic murein transglycosylase-like protein